MPSATASSGLSGEQTRVGVIGGGAWGTALAIHCARMGHEVTLWALEEEVVSSVNGTNRENSTFLPGHKCPDTLTATSNMTEAVANSELVLMVVPTPYIAATVKPIADLLRSDQIFVSCTKGILNDTLETPHEILLRLLPRTVHSQLAYLSGPSFAAEVVKQLPTVVTIAAQEDSVAARVQALLSTPRFRCYRTTDVTGVELGGALKNVLAIACGISDGLDLGNNARAALITRGMNEITKMAVAKGGNPLTMNGLAGMGDLVLTCTGDLSRNRTVGLRLGRGEKLSEITSSMHGAVAEGVLTSKSAHNLALKLSVECPIIEGIYRVIHGKTG
eukprot:GHUV01007024.1.p1 GENE.GHUV01007024.1~~GHUV01007024.1.p1  ORF type:complete len:332 (+),score=54.13 GHUV01007024.1:182-1177(+)